MSLTKYIWTLLIVAGVLFGGREGWQEGMKLGCLPPGGTPVAGGWFESCASDRIGGIDESVVWFGLEPTVAHDVKAADVLMFGDSRIEYAASRGGTAQWVESKGLRYYLLAFGAGAESGWARTLLAKFAPHPAVMVFNADPYFTGGLSPPAEAIKADPQHELHAVEETRAFMSRAASYCRFLDWLCGRTSSGYRAYGDGHLFSLPSDRIWFGKALNGQYPVLTPPAWDASLFESYLADARSIVALAGIDPGCVVFTNVPNSEQDDTLADFLAQRLGATAITPHLEGLFMSDGTHLTVDSSTRWMAQLLAGMEPLLQRCKRNATM